LFNGIDFCVSRKTDYILNLYLNALRVLISYPLGALWNSSSRGQSMESLYPELSIGMCPFRIEECWTEICKQKQEIEDFQW